MAGPLAMVGVETILALGLCSGHSGFADRRELTEVDFSTPKVDDCRPRAVLVFPNTRHTGRVSCVHPKVKGIVNGIDLPQIDKPIVCPITVDVVEYIERPRAVAQCPHDAVPSIADTQNAAASVSGGVNCENLSPSVLPVPSRSLRFGRLAGFLKHDDGSLAPNHASRDRVMINQLCQKSRRM